MQKNIRTFCQLSVLKLKTTLFHVSTLLFIATLRYGNKLIMLPIFDIQIFNVITTI